MFKKRMFADQAPVHLPPVYYDFLKQVLCHEKVELLKYEEEYDNLKFCMEVDSMAKQLKIENFSERKTHPKDYISSFKSGTYQELDVGNCYPLDLHIPWAYEDDMKKYISECRDLKFEMLKKLTVLKWQRAGRVPPPEADSLDSSMVCRVEVSSEADV